MPAIPQRPVNALATLLREGSKFQYMFGGGASTIGKFSPEIARAFGEDTEHGLRTTLALNPWDKHYIMGSIGTMLSEGNASEVLPTIAAVVRECNGRDMESESHIKRRTADALFDIYIEDNELNKEEALRMLLSLLHDPDSDVAIHAAEGISRSTGGPLFPRSEHLFLLVDEMKRAFDTHNNDFGSFDFRIKVAIALGKLELDQLQQIEHRGILEDVYVFLEAALNTKDEKIKFNAATALKFITTERARSILKRALDAATEEDYIRLLRESLSDNELYTRLKS